jgi:ABC-type lipoprotein release transport system permease subunit
MTKLSFVVRNAFRNKRRSVLTVLSIGFSLLLLTLMMTIWRSFYIDKGAPDSMKRVITRDKVSLTFFLPTYYRDKIRSLPGVVAIVPMTYFGGIYKDDRPENSFAQFATDPSEYMKVASDKVVPADQLLAWQRDRAGAMVDVELAKKFGWKIGDRITLKGTFLPVDPELTVRAIFSMDLRRELCTSIRRIWKKQFRGSRDRRDFSIRESLPRTMCPQLQRRLMICFATRPSPQRLRANMPSNFHSWPCSGTSRHSS